MDPAFLPELLWLGQRNSWPLGQKGTLSSLPHSPSASPVTIKAPLIGASCLASEALEFAAPHLNRKQRSR